MTLSQSSGFSFNTPPLRHKMPALFTKMLMGPSSLSTLSIAGSNAPRLLTSTLIASDGTPKHGFRSQKAKEEAKSLREFLQECKHHCEALRSSG
jgi:hypothetical protein